MADSVLFQGLIASGDRVVKELPKMDLESYISNYDGYTKLMRLQCIAMTSPLLSKEAFRIAITQIKESATKNGGCSDVTFYQTLVEALEKLSPSDPLAYLDTDWMEQVTAKSARKTDILEKELKTYKNNLIKESIRMGTEDLGNHFITIGNFGDAYRSYNRMREHCTTSKQIAQMTFKLLYLSTLQRNWGATQSYQLKMSALQLPDKDRAEYDPIMEACSGLAHLSQGQYREAAIAFLKVDQSYTTPIKQAGITFQREVISPNDVAVYGGLCALAKMDREELQRRVLDNSSFRPLLELEPHIRRAISMFCASKYTGCLEILESYQADYLLDLYLQDHFLNLYKAVRAKCIIQWFSAFSVVTWSEIEKAFPQKLEGMSIEDELKKMIMEDGLDARLDLVDKLLICPTPDLRITTIESSLTTARDIERKMRLKLHRINMQAAGFVVKSSNSGGNNISGLLLDDAESKGNSGGGPLSVMGLRGANTGGKVKRGSSGLGFGGF
ncbi:COP9 signalosome-like protein complex subunit 1 [Tothia fuscella]|uniref:COP9 signalosome-like protein complex subunit 1 n=1 Tax=Tothia fuscella TaxID=1048955 RepID=A0A9P4TWQ1_9PEZI|nr:COP9 signalosome-like protein complex subunit 1 [Tothia fuscella]